MTDLVATLVAGPGSASALGEVAARIRAACGASAPDTLGENEALDLFFASTGDIGDVRRRLVALASPAGIDVIVQPVAGRRKRLLVADMDSTLIAQECIDELADFAGKKAEVAAITERAMRGDLAFRPALRERVALLAGMPVTAIDRVIAERITFNPGAATLVATMRAGDAYALLVSGGFASVVERVGARLGFDEFRANLLVTSGGVLTGEVAEPILGREAKRAALDEVAATLDLALGEVLAVGDGANDLDMLAVAGLGVAYHARPKVAEAAAARIDHAGLTALLYAQGYRRAEFAA